MYHHIEGVLTGKTPGEAILEAGGVGFSLKISLTTYQALPQPGQKAKLLVFLNVTQDSLTLYGFATQEERAFFLQLINHVKGVGPKIALAALSSAPVGHLQQAIRLGDVATLKAIKGLGEATAKRIVLELGKILIRQEASPVPPTAKTRKGIPLIQEPSRPAPSSPATFPSPSPPEKPSLSELDEMIGLATKAVQQLNEVPRDVAFRAVQRAYEEFRNAQTTPANLQELVCRALPLTE
jgi:Holliday junction DNA helicase RuvA